MEKFLLDPKAPGAFSPNNFNDAMTNFVYISDKLKEFYPRTTYSRLTKLFNEMDIEWGEIEGTKDIWIRDYMPIQISDDRFIVYNYNPGTVSSDGVVRDNNNMRLGTISSDGTIRDNNNKRIGTASGINTRYVAVLFFFDLF